MIILLMILVIHWSMCRIVLLKKLVYEIIWETDIVKYMTKNYEDPKEWKEFRLISTWKCRLICVN